MEKDRLEDNFLSQLFITEQNLSPPSQQRRLHLIRLYMVVVINDSILSKEKFFLMGISCCSFAGRSNEVIPPAVQTPAHEPIPDPDPDPGTIDHLFDGFSSFLDGNISATSWFSVATTNFSAWLSQASGALAVIWGEDNEFLPTLDDGAIPDGGSLTDSKVRAFTFNQLKAATNNFRSDLVLGKGGFGSVYKGFFKENIPSQGIRRWPIAVKRLDTSSKQGIRQWGAEVGFLARLSHPNIVKLLGYCREDEELLIIYEYMQRGSLNYHLFGKGSKRLLPWETRVQIAIGMAQGLSYLHTLEKPIIFRDFKSSNILLDESYTPKISDFGLAKRAPTAGDSCITGHVIGTTGYAAPEYVQEGRLYVKSDVYSFGVVMAEMLTGLRAIDKNRKAEELVLVDWIIPKLKEKHQLKHIMDSRLEGKYPPKLASKIAILAVKCLGEEAKFRPSMKQVAETLEQIVADPRN